MMKRKVFISVLAFLAVLALCPSVMAPGATMSSIVCDVLLNIHGTLVVIAPTFVALMFVYGGVKYVYGAEDPGVRKSGKQICIHAIIGGIIVAIYQAVVDIVLTGWASC
jgi:hypothetical protein